jgi:tellurite resistance protein
MSDVEVLRAACCVAGLDGTITPEEDALLRKLADKAGVGSVSLRAMVDRAKADHNFYQEQFRLLRGDPVEAMTSLLGVAVSDGQLAPDERVILQYFADRLGLPTAEYERLLRAAEKYVGKRQDKPGKTSDSQT